MSILSVNDFAVFHHLSPCVWRLLLICSIQLLGSNDDNFPLDVTCSLLLPTYQLLRELKKNTLFLECLNLYGATSSPVSLKTGLCGGQSGLDFWQGHGLFPSPPCQDQLWGPP